MKPRFAPAAVLMLAAAAALWAASRMVWLRVGSADGLGQPKTADIIGGTYFPVLTPAALVLIVALGPLWLLRGWALRVLGVALAFAAAALAVPPYAVLAKAVTAVRARQLADLNGPAKVTAVEHVSSGAWVGIAGAILLFVAAFVVVRRKSDDTDSTTKFASPAARRDSAAAASGDEGRELSEREIWDALDIGHDPTARPDGDEVAPNK